MKVKKRMVFNPANLRAQRKMMWRNLRDQVSEDYRVRVAINPQLKKIWRKEIARLVTKKLELLASYPGGANSAWAKQVLELRAKRAKKKNGKKE